MAKRGSVSEKIVKTEPGFGCTNAAKVKNHLLTKFTFLEGLKIEVLEGLIVGGKAYVHGGSRCFVRFQK